jgi:hypothetical protein
MIDPLPVITRRPAGQRAGSRCVLTPTVLRIQQRTWSGPYLSTDQTTAWPDVAAKAIKSGRRCGGDRAASERAPTWSS